MEKLNLLWRYRFLDKFPNEILDSLINQNILGNCVIMTNNIDNEYINTHKNIYAIPRDIEIGDSNIGWSDIYDELIDWNDVPALSQELMESMLPYESMAIKLGMRRVNFPITFYETEKMKYHRHLRFWNYILDKYDINGMYFGNVPHCQHEYVVYGLAKARGIKTILSVPSSVASVSNSGKTKECVFVYGDSIENLGANIKSYYNTLSNASEYTLTGTVKKFFDLHSKEDIEEIKKIENPGNDDLTQAIRNANKRVYFGAYLGKNGFLRETRAAVKYAIKKMLNYPLSEDQYLENICTIRNINYFKRHFMTTQEKYNEHAEVVDYSDKYIYFALQFTPEETVMPRAGVFAEQYTSIQLIARCAMNRGITVYVKEHPHLEFRDRRFYETVRKIKNVKFIKTTESTYDIMKNSIAVATQNGTCILEAVLMKKPAIVVGNGYLWQGLPSLYKIGNEKDGIEAIDNICNNPKIDLNDLKRYFFAIEKSTLLYKFNEVNDETSTVYDDATIEKNIELIKMLVPSKV